MTQYEFYSLIAQVVTGVAAIIFAAWQIFINNRLKNLNDFVAVAIIPNTEDGNIKLLNTGKINLYINGYEINGALQIFQERRLIPAGSLDSAYYWLPVNNIPQNGLFDIKIYLTDEYKKKYITLGGGESFVVDAEKSGVKFWTLRTEKNKWDLNNTANIYSK